MQVKSRIVLNNILLYNKRGKYRLRVKAMNKDCEKIDVGGQAIIEGVMMRAKDKVATAVRKPDGDIDISKKTIKSFTGKNKLFKLPIIRGVVMFFQSMIIGVKSLMYSAEFYDIEDEEPSKLDKFLEKMFGDKIQDITIIFSVIVAVILAVALFGLLPTVIVGFTRKILVSHVAATTVEGVLKIGIFLLYLFIISRLKDVQRVFEYHGAEHKSIYCYESKEELTVENVKKHSRLHPRCGTSFLLIVLIVSIIVFSFISWDNLLMRVVWKIILLPIVAGVSYEIIKYAGRSNNIFVKIVSFPGLALQRLTTREPDSSQIEVAIAAINGVLNFEENEEKLKQEEKNEIKESTELGYNGT